MGDFDGLVAAVTGGASGIGAAVATELAAQGARVAVLDLQPPDGSQHAVALRTDVTEDASVRAAIEQILAELGRLDVLVNNAGIGAQGTVEDNDDAEWLRVLDVNLIGMVRTSRAALPALRRSPSAAIVNTGSIAATAGLPQRVLYSATKGAVLALTRAMAADHLAEGIRVNCLNPGTADTPWIGRLLARADDPEAERAARQPHGRMVSPEEQSIGASYGAAFLAAQLVTSASIDAWNPVQEAVTPRPEAVEQYEDLYRLYRDLYPRTADTVHALAARQVR